MLQSVMTTLVLPNTPTAAPWLPLIARPWRVTLFELMRRIMAEYEQLPTTHVAMLLSEATAGTTRVGHT